MNIRVMAFDMAQAVERFKLKAQQFFYQVMLLPHRCPNCNSSLTMVTEGRATCNECGYEFDPTVAFQRCSSCGGSPELNISRYRCGTCKSNIQSRFHFDGLVFDRDYFRDRMAESRQRKKMQQEKVQQMLAQSRSNTLSLLPANLEAYPDLIQALNRLSEGPQVSMKVESKDGFDLHRYTDHIQAHIQDFPISLSDIPPLTENRRNDMIWCFIAAIFMAHTSQLNIWQDGPKIMVTQY